MQKLIECIDDKDPISLSTFWILENNNKKIVYPENDFDQLVFYYDNKNNLRCFEKESLMYLKTYKVENHPVTFEKIPEYLFDNIDIIKLEDKTIKQLALDVFQLFSNNSVFIDFNLFLNLEKKDLLRFNYELSDFWINNFSEVERKEINHNIILNKVNYELDNYNLENIQKYLLNQMEILLKCNNDKYKYMINYIMMAALSIVIPEIKEIYSNFIFSF